MFLNSVAPLARTATTAFFLVVGMPALAQDESSLRAADDAQLAAARAGDSEALAAMAAPGFIINSPMGDTGTRERVVGRFRSGAVAHDRFDRVVERIAIIRDVGIVMGRDVVIPSAASLERGWRRPDGKPVERRFTNVYLWEAGKWRWVARHANYRADPPSGGGMAR